MNRLEKVRKKIQKFINFPDKESKDDLNKMLNEFGKEYERMEKINQAKKLQKKVKS